jgi:trimeric autotransporter adhesin
VVDSVAGSPVGAVASPAAGLPVRAVPESSTTVWRRSGHWRAVVVGGVVAAVVIAAGVFAWTQASGGNTGYRTASVTRADIGTSMSVVGNVEPVSDSSASFQVSGQVATVSVTPGQQVTVGQTLGTLNTTALSETVSSDQSSVSADEAKLVEDEENENSTSSTTPSAQTQTSTPSSTTTTTTPSGSGPSSTQTAITKDQATLTGDESTLSTDQQKEAADLSQAQKDCTSANTATTTGRTTCETALQTVSADEQRVTTDESTVSKDETALGQALAAESSGGSGSGTSTGSGSGAPTGGGSGAPTGNSGTGSTGHAVESASTDFTGNTGTGSPGAGSTGTDSTGGTGSTGSPGGSAGGTSTDTDTPEQIASDQADVDSSEADLTEAQESLNEATLTSPIDGTVVAVGITAGDTVSADSSTDTITIIGTDSYEAQATLDSSQVPSVKVGQSATVEVDGLNGNLVGTVAQVGPVESDDGSYDYPVVVALPSSAAAELYTGSTANVNISTGSVSNVVAVPTSAVQTRGTRSFVEELTKGQLTAKVIKTGMIGDTYTQVLSGLSPGQSVVLADYSEAVPSSSANENEVLGGGGGFGGFGGGGFGGPGGATFRISRAGAGGGFGG